MTGIKISNHAFPEELERYNFDFIIIDATNGTGSQLPKFQVQCAKALEMGKIVACSHICNTNKNTTVYSIVEEADWFSTVLDVCKFRKSVAPVVDWTKDTTCDESLLNSIVHRLSVINGTMPFIRVYEHQLLGMRGWWAIGSCKLISVRDHDHPAPEMFGDIAHIGSINIEGGIEIYSTDMTKNEWLNCIDPYGGEKISPELRWALETGRVYKDENGELRCRDIYELEKFLKILNKI